jgi:predicted O-methyltransferase YrrM
MPKQQSLFQTLRTHFPASGSSLRRLLPTQNRPNESWYWKKLAAYRDKQGRTLKQAELAWMEHANVFCSEAMRREFLTTNRWMSSPRPSSGPLGVSVLAELIGAFYGLEDDFTYLEFGLCFGTTFAQILGTFKNARGIGIEIVPERFEVAQWMIEQADATWKLQGRAQLRCSSVLQANLPESSVDVVFMDTSHAYPDEYHMVRHLFDAGMIKPKFLFVGDDPMHSGTDVTRRRLITEWGERYKFITRPDLNLYWFFKSC